MNILDVLISGFVSNIGIFIILGLIVLFFNIIKLPIVKGMIGEAFVNFMISKNLDKEEYRLLKNVILKTEDGTTQIDHILVSVYGLFVLETKNMKGWIFGSERQAQWTQQIFKKKIKFQNPIHQNYKHTKTLSNNFNIDHSNIKNIILFVGKSKIKNEIPKGVFENVSDAIEYILEHKEKKYTYSQAYDIFKSIRDNRISNTIKNHRKHAKHVKEIIKKRKNN